MGSGHRLRRWPGSGKAPDGQEDVLGKKIGWRLSRRRDAPAWLLQRSFPPVFPASAHHPGKMTPPHCMGIHRFGVLGLTRKLGMFGAVWELGGLTFGAQNKKSIPSSQVLSADVH